MSILKKEAAFFFAFLAAIAEMAVLFYTDHPGARGAWLLPVLPVLAAWATRHYVFSENTIREAGLDPERVKADSDNPHIDRNRTGEPWDLDEYDD